MSKERFDMMEIDEEEEEDEKKEIITPFKTSSGRVLSPSESFSDSRNSFCLSPITPKSVLPEQMMGSPGKSGDFVNSASHLLWNMRVQALEKLSPIDVKRLAIHILSQKEALEPNNGEDEIKEEKNEGMNSVVKMETDESVVLDEQEDTIMKISSLDSTSESKLVDVSEKSEMMPESLASPSPPPLSITKTVSLPSQPPPPPPPLPPLNSKADVVVVSSFSPPPPPPPPPLS